MTRIVLLGCPRPIGGCNVEAGHTALLWRKMGYEVRVISHSLEPTGNPWPARLAAAGCEVILDHDTFRKQRDELCVAFQQGPACAAWPTLAAQGCHLIWSPGMLYTLPHESRVFKLCPPSGLHFQSAFQQSEMGPTYTRWARPMIVPQFHIPGVFDVGDFPYRPLRHNGEFVVGKLSRAWPDKFPKDLWQLLGTARARARVHLQSLVMGWSEAVEAKCGPPPPWATVYHEGTFTSQEFLGRCHALFCARSELENWPRVGLEAGSAGVPVIADASGGWLEMIQHGENGLLVTNNEEGIAAICELTSNELKRISLAKAGRAAVEKITDPDVLASQWRELFQTVKA